jgi:hypothetical protein
MTGLSYLLMVMLITPSFAILEEFVVRGPGDLHKAAIDTYLADRKANPDHKDLGDDENPIFQRARDYAVKRFSAKSEESLKVQVNQFTECATCTALRINRLLNRLEL